MEHYEKKTGLPTDFWQWKPIKEVRAQPIIRFCGDLMVCRWSDWYKLKSKKIVSMLSTRHAGVFTESGKMDFRSKTMILKPDVIVEYNATMGGVDTLIRVLNPYLIQRKGLKWYRKVAELLIDISIYNSFILYKKLNHNLNITNLTFRQKLIEEIISFHLFGQQAVQTGSYNHSNPLRLTERHFIRRISQKGGARVRRNCVRFCFYLLCNDELLLLLLSSLLLLILYTVRIMLDYYNNV